MRFSIKTLLLVILLVAVCVALARYYTQTGYLVAEVKLDNDYSIRYLVEYRPDDVHGDYYCATVTHAGVAHRPMGMIRRNPEVERTTVRAFYSTTRKFVVVPTPGERYDFICGDLTRGYFVQMDEMIRNFRDGITLSFWLDAVNEVAEANPDSGIQRIDY